MWKMSVHGCDILLERNSVENVARGRAPNAYFGARQWGQKGPRPTRKKHPRKSERPGIHLWHWNIDE